MSFSVISVVNPVPLRNRDAKQTKNALGDDGAAADVADAGDSDHQLWAEIVFLAHVLERLDVRGSQRFV